MAAECYWCEVRKRKIANPTGKANHPLGCCSNCQVFACGHHAQLDNHAKEFMCFNCDTSILIASGSSLALNAALDQPAKDAIAKVIGKKIYGIDYFMVKSEKLFSSFDDLQNRRTGYKDWFPEIEMFVEDFRSERQELDFFQHIPINARLLLTAAAYILNKTAPGDDLDNDQATHINALRSEILRSGGLMWQTNAY